MNTSLNISWINNTNTNIYLDTQDNRESEIGFNSSKLNFTWNVSSYKNESMYIDI